VIHGAIVDRSASQAVVMVGAVRVCLLALRVALASIVASFIGCCMIDGRAD